MKGGSKRSQATLRAAEQVAGILQGLEVETAVIGALALAVHKYVRQTVGRPHGFGR